MIVQYEGRLLVLDQHRTADTGPEQDFWYQRSIVGTGSE
jgi:hypothetical protein